jgi:hypothetical protein
MKKIIIFILLITAFSSSFCQTGIYGMFYFKGGLNSGTILPYPIKVSTIGPEKFEIVSDLDGRSGNKLKYIGEFVEYDKWERLYKYHSIEKWYPGGVKKNGIEYTTETYITCRRKLSDFANGLKIDPNGMVEDTKIEITETTTSRWSKEDTQYYSIVLFNDNTSRYNQNKYQPASPKSITKIPLYRAVLKKVPVFDEPSLSSNSFPHDFYDERFACQELKNGFIFAISEYGGGRIWYGWIHTSALVKFGECWIENGRIESLLINDESVSADSAKLIMNENKQWIEQSSKMVIESVEEYTANKAKSKANDSKTTKVDSPSSSPDLTGITTNAVYFKVIAEKAYFYDEPNHSFKRNGYLISGKQFLSLYSKNGFVYTVLTSISGIQTKGWIRIEDISKLD